jgi:hypothetical protein
MSLRAFARAIAAIGILLVTTISGNEALGAGAMAIGSCAAYGYAFDYTALTEARSAALTKCTGRECRIVADVRHGCGAFAIDGRNACGAKGFAVAPTLGQAENQALANCYKDGGHDCVIRVFACDAKG